MPAPQLPHVLVVDDSADIRRSLVELLDVLGYPATEAADGAAGLVALETLPRPCLVLLDMQMPNVDGATFLARLEGAPDRSSLGVVVMSALPETPRFRALLGVADVLVKPFGQDELLAALTRVTETLPSATANAEQSEVAARSPDPASSEV